MTGVAILRPEPGASETLAKALAMGLDAFAMPMFKIEPVRWSVPDTLALDGLLLTSANAVRLAGDELTKVAHLPAYTVGPATAKAARSLGLDVAAEGAGGLANLLATLDSRLRLLHLAGEDRIDVDMPAGPEIVAVTVYRARTVDAVEDLTRLERGIAMIHSPRAARQIADLVDRHGIDRSLVAIAAISPAAAGAAGIGWSSVVAADQPNDEALLALAAELCKMIAKP